MAILRALFFLLLLGNLVLFAWGHGYLGGGGEGHEPQRLKDQVQPEKLRLVPPAAVTTAAKPAAPAPAQACRLATGLAPADAEKLRAALAAIAGLTTTVRPEAEPPSYWVMIPPQANKAAADKKAGELKALGVTDFFVVKDEGATKFAISLGLFKTEEAAQELLAALGKKGVRSARMEVQQKPAERTQVEVRGPAEAVAKGLAGQPAAALADCPAS